MKRINQAVALIMLSFSGFVIFQASRLRYYSSLGPGPGFFPLWLGIVMAVLGVLWLVQVSRADDTPVPSGFWPSRIGALRVGAVVLSLVVVIFTLDLAGFRLVMFAMLAFLLYALGRQNLFVTLIVALLGSFGFYYVLTAWLGAELPSASLEILANLGL